jgi:hypothetical protein
VGAINHAMCEQIAAGASEKLMKFCEESKRI